LTARGIHYIATRFGPLRCRGIAFDEKYRCGHWVFESDGGPELTGVICRYLRKGDLLILGCGSAAILEDLKKEGMNSALGIDISQEGIRLASRFACDNVSFQVADMVRFECPQAYDVILFSESLNYVPSMRQVPLLKRMAGSLRPNGALLVTLSESKRYWNILIRIRRNFNVLEDFMLSGSNRHVIAFRSGRPEAAGGPCL
jgi:2-polyprenyl-3-methyl-5-hydroxy-6-metoxy-1,4-benzoquinol methylase